MTDIQPIVINDQSKLLKDNESHGGIMEDITVVIDCQDIITNVTKAETNILPNRGIRSMTDSSIRMVVRPKGGCKSRNSCNGFLMVRPRLNLWKWLKRKQLEKK